MNERMYLISPRDPDAGSSCGEEHHWMEVRQRTLYWRSCGSCALTECNVPGLDRCYHFPIDDVSRDDLTPEEYFLLFMTLGQCDRLTTERCPLCELGICSDHIAAHIAAHTARCEDLL